MNIVHNYRDDEALRRSFNELADKVFGLSFEKWYQDGFWKDNYDPYSVVEDNKVVANISVNRCNIMYNGRKVKLIQLGTVMTDPECRGRGYARLLMEKILEEFESDVDGIYLYANDSVTDFYPKFGFTERKEYCYSKDVDNDNERSAVPVDWDKMPAILDKDDQIGKVYMVSNTGLYMFYLSQFMTGNSFCIKDQDTYMIAEEDDGTLIVHAVIGDADIDRVAEAFGSGISKVILGYTPADTTGFEEQEVVEEDTHLFVRGRFFEDTKDDRYMFQAITHA